MQSAAFVITDVRKCIEIGLAAIPAESRMAKSIKFVMDCYDKGMAPMDTRVAVQEMNADIGNGWFEAPSNVAYAVIGLLWGEGDFKKTMITAINCGDDTDCTAATVGATLGIMYGMAGIPADWHEHLGDGIVTVSIAGGLNPKIPKTCTELTERVVEVAPWMLAANRDLTDVRITECGETEIPENIGDVMYESAARVEKVIRELKPFTTNFACPNYSVQVTMEKAPDIEPGGEISFTVTITNNWQGNINEPFNLNLRWMLPEGFSISGGRRAVFMEPYSYRKPPFVTLNFTIKAGEVVNEINRAVLEISAVGRPTIMYIPITLLG
jgi:hypothetical protein